MYLSFNGWQKHEELEERELPVWPPPPTGRE
jgi:hypothetical protein